MTTLLAVYRMTLNQGVDSKAFEKQFREQFLPMVTVGSPTRVGITIAQYFSRSSENEYTWHIVNEGASNQIFIPGLHRGGDSDIPTVLGELDVEITYEQFEVIWKKHPGL